MTFYNEHDPKAAAWLGELAATANRGALNPAHSRWLMGKPRTEKPAN